MNFRNLYLYVSDFPSSTSLLSGQKKKQAAMQFFFLMAMHTHTLTHICVVGGFHSFIDLFVGQQDSPFPVC